MTIHIKVQSTPFDTYQDFSIESERVHNVKLQMSYSHAARLSFKLAREQHKQPVKQLDFIKFWDDAGTNPRTSSAYSESDPTFEGFVEEVNPGRTANEVEVIAYDPTHRVAQEITVMSLPWSQGQVGSGSSNNQPVPGTGAIPRIVFNSKIDNDDDYMWERAHDSDIGTILSTLFDDQYHPLYWLNAAPGDGSSAGNGSAYVSADLTSLDYKPQEKIVFETETLRSAVNRILQMEPEYKLLWYPGTRKWRFLNIKSADQTTLTLNDFSGTNKVLSFELTRSIDGKHTAVKFYGPPAAEQLEVRLSSGGLTDISDDPIIDTYAAGATVRGKNRWQITDTNKRRVLRWLAQIIYAPHVGAVFGSPTEGFTVIGMYTTPTRSPSFQARWNTTKAGNDEWTTIEGWHLDALNGIIDFGNSYVYRYNDNPDISGGILQPNVENPVDVRFIYATPSDTVTARFPTNGFSGTAYSELGLERELLLYDEMLAVNYEYFNPVTTAVRIAQFEKLAEKLHAERSDVSYSGGCSLDGIQYDFQLLDKRINIAAEDGDGNALVTGWESIDAILTDVEFDYELGVTTLQFSSDQLELMGVDPDQVKEELKIRALKPVYFFDAAVFHEKRRAFTELGTPVIGADTTVRVDFGRVFVDFEDDGSVGSVQTEL